jgi:hypothetical protein
MKMLRVAALGAVLFGGALVPGQLAAQENTGPDTVVYSPRRGTVTFTHAKHAADPAQCVTCHHESKDAKPLASPRQKCGDCHTTPATEPVTTSLRNAFHVTAEETGLCFDCHKKEAAAGKKVPAVCDDCHKRAN